MDRSEENRAIGEIVERLEKVFPQVDSDQVRTAVEQSRPEFEGSPIRDYVPLFVERSAKHKLRQLTG